MRIASLLASGTELVCALGAGEQLVARSHECDEPPWIARLPIASRPTFPIDGTSAEIDAHVRERLHAGRPLYQVDEALLLALAPDVILTQTHCEVCAVSPADVGEPELCRRQVATLHAGTIAGVLDGFLAVADAIERPTQGRALVDRLRARLDAASAGVAGRPRPRVACIEWIEPIFGMGNWGPELVARAGGESVLGVAGGASVTTGWDEVVAADADILLIAPCGFGLERAWREMPTLAARPGFADLRAARADQVYVADGNLYFNRSSPSLIDTVELLVELLHPGAAAPRFGHAWRRWLTPPAA